MFSQIINIVLRVLAVILITIVSAVAGLILGAIVGGNLAGLYELISGQPFVFNGREGYEATGQIGTLLGALLGFIASAFYMFGKRIMKKPLPSSEPSS